MSNKSKVPAMGERTMVYAVQGRKVLDEQGRIVTSQGTRVTYNHYWLRLERDGDVTRQAPAAASTKKGAK